MLLKAVIFLSMPLRVPARRLRNGFTTIELAGACYRLLLPMPLWFHWLFHAAQDAANTPSLWSVGCSHMYVGFKLVSLVERARRAAVATRAVLAFQLPIGKYATAEEVMEMWDRDGNAEQHIQIKQPRADPARVSGTPR